MVSLTINGEQMNGEIILFYVFHKYRRDIFFRGILDMDLYEETSDPIQYLDKDRNILDKIPPNPHEKGSLEWEAYELIVSKFRVTDDFIQLLTECASIPETHSYEWFDIEMESLTW